MLIQQISDIHIDHFVGGSNYPKISKNADLIVLCGDTTTYGSDIVFKHFAKFLKHIRKVTQVPIVFVLGNHDYFGSNLETPIQHFKQVSSKFDNVYCLQNEAMVVQGLNIFGSTFWSSIPRSIFTHAHWGMADYCYIYCDNLKTPVQCEDTNLQNDIAVNSLLDASEVSKIDLIVTHHMPSFDLVSERYKTSRLTYCFASNCNELIKQVNPKAWMFGHTHEVIDKVIEGVRCVCNPFGYSFEKGVYIEEFLVEI
jgi:predicted phosphodiesterase